jgi:hypothetical protein
MVPRSPIGQFISDMYWSVRQGTKTGKGLVTGKGVRGRRTREIAEVAEDRERGALKAFQKEYEDIQKDVVLSTAYDRMFRFNDPVRGINEEIANRIQRG